MFKVLTTEYDTTDMDLKPAEATVSTESPPAERIRWSEAALDPALLGPRRGSDADLLSRTSLVIPTLNEAKNLMQLAEEMPAEIGEIIVVDGLSTDNTIETARALWPSVRIVLQPVAGKGAALKAGFEAATREFIAMIDADGSMQPSELVDYLRVLHEGADLAKGSRYLIGGGSDDLTFLRSAGNRVLTQLVNVLWKTEYTDLCYGYAAFRRSVASSVMPNSNGFEVETFINIRATTEGLAVAEVPSWERPRWHGESNLRVVRDGLRIARTILQEHRKGRSERRN